MNDAKTLQCEILETNPYFDIELLMETSQESRIDGDLMDALTGKWEAWLSSLNARKLTPTPAPGASPQSYLLVWLDEKVEEEVDDIWDDRPSEAFLFNALAQTLCMGAIYDLLPEVAEAGCAPAPAPDPALAAALAAQGVPYADQGPALDRRYAVASYYPFRGACEICCLAKECPKLLGQGGGLDTLVLPGHEPGKD